ncbi:Two-component transcriptional response regulator, LuxR family [Citrifermentans bremense]|uniref:Two-component transcriptional response regulator, LuxR family n=1 Tax=Citrifermentans bremense TaxID=60035 RepID=A0A6S6M6F1_9BACT|nr:EAL domain-containing protein [Citrifermentans bremense]BCG47201.1 Two-component transcriptional response regulator, LuxR family [Citrifermentans bremense]
MEPLNRPLKDIALLLVEDEIEARDMLARMLGLNYQGVRIYTADDGVSGLETYRQFRPEIVVTDINMPQMNGIAMAREIKALDPEATIVAVTAHSETNYLLSSIEKGMDHYVLKPVNYPELFHVLDRIADKIVLKRLVSEQVERIRRREQQLSQAERITHLGSWELNLETGESVWSDELYRILGLEPESVPATFDALLQMLHPADRETLEKAVRQLRETGSAPGTQYYRLLRPDGETRIVRGQLEAVRDGESGRQTVIGACHDVTELKWAEAALRASERRFSKIFQATPDLLSITSLKDGIILEVNEAFLRALGYERQEVVGTYAGELGLWADSDQPGALLQQLEERGEVRDIEVRLKGRNGRELEGLVSAELIEINGSPYLLTLFKDISERKRLEEDRARLAAIVESSDDAIMAVDREGAITSWNAGAEKMFGYSAQDMKGVHLSFLVSPDQKEQVLCLNDGIRSDGAVTHCEVVHVTRGGRQIYVSLTMSPIKSADGSIVGTSCIARDVTERTRMEEIIKHQAQHDTLTDLPNRKLFGDFLNLELAQARRNRKSLAVLFMDLDRFKQVNDNFGHQAGDDLLKAVAQRLKRCVRESDTVARISGDEFNVLMPDLTQTDDVGIVVGKIMGVFQTPFVLEGAELKVTTSVGVSMFPDDGDSAQELLQKADGAMYVAKQTEGNSYQFYNSEINARTVTRQNMERRLREAVLKNELELVYQPLLSLESGLIVGAEALLRWRHPEQGLLLPSQFLPIAEETGVIVPIGEWVIFNACRQMRLWQRQGFDLSVAVNLSHREFNQPNFIDLALRALSQSGLDPASLELDVPEKAIMDNPAFSLRNMRRLTDIGVAFSVDDFGVGASSLSRIKELPIAKVKIDRSFIRDILTEPNDLDVVSAVICMSHSLKMRVNAVGVESHEQLELVESFGCDEVQGDLISAPLPPHEFERLLIDGGVHAEF